MHAQLDQLHPQCTAHCVETVHAIRDLCHHTDTVTDLCFDPNNDDIFASSSKDGTVLLCHVSRGEYRWICLPCL